MKKFKCTKKWARNSAGDIVEEYMLRRYPADIQRENFVEVTDKPKKTKSKVKTNTQLNTSITSSNS